MMMGPEPMMRIDFMSVRRGIGSNLIGSKDGLEGPVVGGFGISAKKWNRDRFALDGEVEKQAGFELGELSDLVLNPSHIGLTQGLGFGCQILLHLVGVLS